MAFRFRVSKYKNQTVKLPTECAKQSQFQLPPSLPTHSSSNWIAASGYLYAHLSDLDQISVSSIEDTKSNSSPQSSLQTIRHVGFTDLDWSPFSDDVLALSGLESIRIYRIPAVPNDDDRTVRMETSNLSPLIDWSLTDNFGGITGIKFHPIVSSLFGTIGYESKHFSLYDYVNCGNCDTTNNEPLPLQSYDSGLSLKSFDFDHEGRTLVLAGPATAGFTAQLYDVRSNEVTEQFTMDDVAINSNGRICFLNHSNHLLSSNIDQRRHRIVSIWDVRQLTKPIAKSIDSQQQSSTTSANIYIPLYDSTTGLLYFGLQNGNSLAHCELEQLLQQSTNGEFDLSNMLYSIAHTIKGMTLSSKRSLNVMQTEINRLLLLTSRLVYPISYHIPRKSYTDFHSDLYENIPKPDSITTVDELLSPDHHINGKAMMLNLDPKANKSWTNLLRFGINQSNQKQQQVNRIDGDDDDEVQQQPNLPTESISIEKRMPIGKQNSLDSETSSSTVTNSASSSSLSNSTEVKSTMSSRQQNVNAIAKKFVTAKCKYLKGTIGGRETQLTNVQNICKNISPLCDPFKANHRYGLFPLGTGVGGGSNQIAIIDLDRPQRLSGGVQSHIQCPDVVTDFTFDPFRFNRIAIGQVTGSILIYTIQPLNDECNMNQDPLIVDSYDTKLIGHNGRINVVAFNPQANDILASCGTDNRVLVWNIATEEILYQIDLSSMEQQIFSIAWNRCLYGSTRLAILGRSRTIYVYNVQSGSIVQRGSVPYRLNNGRLIWIGNDRAILATGFNGLSERQFYVFEADDLQSGAKIEYGLDVSPSILVPTFDDDTQTLFLTGKGDSIVYTFEIDTNRDELGAECITPLSHFDMSSPHQAISFIAKQHCDFRRLEFARGFRLTSNSIEPFSFTIPRLQLDYFHDDLFPPTVITWSPQFSAAEWHELANVPVDDIPPVERVSLKPDDMVNYSEVRDRLAAEKTEKIRMNQLEKLANEQREAIEFANIQQASLSDPSGDPSFSYNLAEMIRMGKEKQETLVQQISCKVEFDSSKTNLESVEGVDPDEWED
ncbi:Coronin-7 [Blomia tropicalis]|nr:Coronin-7 [Blomia tropicalis]